MAHRSCLTWWATAKRSSQTWLLRPASPQGWLYWFTQQFAFVFVWEVWGMPDACRKRGTAGAGCPGSHFPQADAQRLGAFEQLNLAATISIWTAWRANDKPACQTLIYSQAKVRDLRHRGALQNTRIFVRYQIASMTGTEQPSRRVGFLDSTVANHLSPLMDQINQTNIQQTGGKNATNCSSCLSPQPA